MKAEATAGSSVLERYVRFTGNFLTGREREDIIVELRANLQAEMDDRAEALGRPLSGSEEAALLVQHGHPIAVAARYFPLQQLIGAPWIALYWLILRQVVTIILVVGVVRVILGATVQHGSAAAVLGKCVDSVGEALLGFAWVTLSFTLVSYFGDKYRWLEGSEWDARKLPSFDVPSPERQVRPLSRLGGAIFGLGMLVTVRGWTSVLPSWLTAQLRFCAGWHAGYEYLLAGAVVGVIAALAVVLRPDWRVVRPAAEVVTLGLSLGGLTILLNAASAGKAWVMLATPDIATDALRNALATTNIVIFWSIAGTMIGVGIALVVAVWECATILRRRNPELSAGLPHVC